MKIVIALLIAFCLVGCSNEQYMFDEGRLSATMDTYTVLYDGEEYSDCFDPHITSEGKLYITHCGCVICFDEGYVIYKENN